ncbi:MAG: RNA 2',3'-cyclic phosphodiesterase [Candidatus Aenigmatarchaeota archaeon]
MRLFIAISPPDEIKSKIAGLADSVSSNESGLKKVSKENCHLTLKFLGEVDEKKLEEIKATLSNIKSEGFKISLNGIGFFPGAEYIKVVWAGVEGGKTEAINLQKEIDERLSKLGFKKEKNFEPHLTIARVKFLKDKSGFLEKLKKADFKGEFTVESIELVESTLTPKGPVYRVISRFNLN